MDILDTIKSGEWGHYKTDEIGTLLAACEEKCFELNSLPPSAKLRRQNLIKEIIGDIKEPFILHSPFHCDFGKNISIGENFVGNFNLTILDEAEVRIGKNVFIGPNVSIYTVTHAFNHEQRNEGIMRAKPISIGNDTWICGNVTILPGVSIGACSIIGAGSVVNSDIPDNVLATGNPCKIIRNITESDRLTQIIN